MTFVLSQINKDGITMASDSSETCEYPDGRQEFCEVDKTLYFPSINAGISTWGSAQVGDQGINEWLEAAISEFVKSRSSVQHLEKITKFLAGKLDKAFGIDGNKQNKEIHMGLHIAGFNSASKNTLPGICHVFIEPGFYKFAPQLTVLSLPNKETSYQLRNGMYEEFAIMWPALSGIDASFRTLIASRYKNDLRPSKDPMALQAEWLGNWVKQMCLVIKTAGLPEYIGKTVKVLAFNSKGKPRWFYLNEISEISK